MMKCLKTVKEGMTMKQYKFVDPDETINEMLKVLVNGLGRGLTEQELKTVIWLGNTEYETRGVLLDLFKELANKGESK